jgi:hypothetical protein
MNKAKFIELLKDGASMDVWHTPVAFGGGGYLLEVR